MSDDNNPTAGGQQYDDQTLTCEECGAEYTFTAGEQEFFATKGFTPPKRCQNCRQKKKEERQSNRQMTEVECAKCGVTTTVPFVPRGDRPVLCRDCFDAERNAA